MNLVWLQNACMRMWSSGGLCWLLEVLGVLKKRLKVKKFQRFCQWFITFTCVCVFIVEVCWYLQEARNSRRCCKLIGRLTWTRWLGEYFIHIHILCVSLLTSWEWGCMRWGCGRSTSSRCRPRRSRGRSTDTSRTSPGSHHHHCK